MTWYRFADKTPPKDVMLNVFRHCNKKYLHAKFVVKDCKIEGVKRRHVSVWYSQHKDNYECSPYDAWQEMEYYCESGVTIMYDGKRK